MTDRSLQPPRDLLRRPVPVLAGYGIPIAVLIVAGTLDLSKSVTGAIWAVAVLAMGMTCAINARRCGRVHCYFTAPFLFLMAIAIFLFGLNVPVFAGLSFELLGNVLGIGSALLWLGSEIIFGQYFSRSDRNE